MGVRRQSNHTLIRVLLAGALLAALAPVAAQAATYLKLSGVEGAYQARPGWIPIDSFSVDVAAPEGGARDRTKVTISKTADANSPALSKAAAEGRLFAVASIEVTGPAGEVTERYQLSEVVISDMKITDAGARPHERLTLTCARLATERVPATGPMRAGQAERLN